MHKISRIIVKEMAMLSNEEMALITGGNDGTGSSTTESAPCGPGRVGQACDLTGADGKTYKGHCYHYAYSDDYTSINRYYCA